LVFNSEIVLLFTPDVVYYNSNGYGIYNRKAGMKTLSTGEDSTLGTYKKWASIFGDTAVAFKSGHGKLLLLSAILDENFSECRKS